MTNREFERQARESMRVGVAGTYDLRARDSARVTITVPKSEKAEPEEEIWRMIDDEY